VPIASAAVTPPRSTDREILALALPAMAALAAEPLYEITDVAILGHLGTATLAGAVIATNLLLLGSAVFIFLMFGTTAAVSRLLGAGQVDQATRHGIGGMWLGAGLGVVVAAVMALLGPTLIGWWGGTGATAAAALTYFEVSLIGYPAVLLVMAGTGYVRGTGNTRTPLAIAVVTVAGNLVLELVLIYGLGFGVGASAAATVVAKWAGAGAYLVIVVGAARRRTVSLRPDRSALAQLSATGWPLFVRTAVLRGTVAASVALAARLGPVAVAGYGLAFTIWSFLAYVADGLEVAGQVLVGRRLGASDEGGARSVGNRILRMALAIGVVAFVAVMVLRKALPHLFTADPAVIAVTVSSLWWVAVAQPVNALTFSLDGILVGAGDLRFLAAAMVGAAMLVTPLGIAIAAVGAPLWCIWVAMLTFMGARLVSLGVRYRGRRWVRTGAVSGSSS